MTRWKRFILLRKWRIGLMVTIAFVLIILLGSFFIRYEIFKLRSEKNDEFAAISKLKINQLVQWQQERFGDATVLSHLPFFISLVDQWLHNKNNVYINQSVKERLAVFYRAYGYKSICLSSVNGDLLLTVGSSAHFDAFISEKIVEAITLKKVTCTDFYYSKEEDKINYDFIAPLVDEKDKAIAALVFRIDPEKSLYPLIQFWPTPSKTFETLLVRKEKDSIVFLSDLRFLPNSALREKIPMTETERPSVLAALGRTGMWDGKDYRDVDVVSYLSSVPVTNWFMVTKIDKGEFYKELYRQTTFFFLGFGLFLLLMAAGITALYGNRQRKIIRELWKTSEELATTLHSIGDAVISTDKQGKVNYMNQVAERLTGWTSAEAKEKNIAEVFKIINEDTRTISANPVEAVLLKGTVVGLTNHTLLISKDGREISIADSGAPIKSKNGDIIGVVLVFQDQTEERETQKKLTSSELSYRRLFESAKDGILILDAENGMIIDVNPFLVALLGYSKEQFLAKAIWEIGFLKDIVANRDKFLELQQREYVRYEDLPLETVEGQKKNVEFVSNVYFAGKQKVIQCNIRDITDRLHAEEELRTTKDYLDNLITYANSPIIVWNPDYEITRFNHAFEHLSGYNADEALGEKLDFLFPKSNIKESLAEIEKTSTGEHWESVEIPILHKNGQVLIVLWNSAAIYEKGGKKIIATIAQGQDITSRKQAEQELEQKNIQLNQANIEKDKFFSIIAHDLRSPFNIFLGFTKLLEDELPTMTQEQTQKIAVTLRKSATGLYSLLEDLLEWSKLQRGFIFYNPESILLKQKVLIDTALVKESAIKKEIDLSYDIPEDIMVFADEKMLGGILRNLASNAMKFTPNGGKVTISAKPIPSEWVEISVNDTGIGMNREMIENLFQIEINTSRKGTENEPSSGFGLILCKDFVEKHGGKLWVESEINIGSTFYFTLSKANETEPKPIGQDFPSDLKKNTQAKNLKILIVEDDEASRMILSISLKKDRNEVLEVRTGFDAVEACLNHPDIDLVLIDIRLPNMDGYEATRQIRQFNKEVIIIAQTAFGLSGDREKAIESGCNDYLSKPIAKDELLGLIQKHFHN